MALFSHVGMTVTDLERSVEFYCDVFECTIKERGSNSTPELAQLTGVPNASVLAADLVAPDGTVLELIQYLNPSPEPLRQEPDQPGHTQIAFWVPDVDAFHRKIVTRYKLACTPPTTLSEPGSSWDNVRACYALDPDGRTVGALTRGKPL